jgi:hypothetical protein
MRRFSLLALTICLCAVSHAWAADDSTPADDNEAAERLQFMVDSAGKYRVTSADGEATRLELHPEPLLRFSNTVSGVPDGILVLWKIGSRPAAIAQVFLIKEGLWIHEGQSIAPVPLQFELNGEVKWAPREAAPAPQPLDGAPAPAGSPVPRLRQMRRLAERFTGTDDFKISPTDAEAERNELRMLPTPVYRYESVEDGVVDGAVFAFVHGTDPEMLLVLEAQDDGSGAQWQYSLAAMTCWAVQAQLDGEEVWTSPERFAASTSSGLYHVWVYQL